MRNAPRAWLLVVLLGCRGGGLPPSSDGPGSHDLSTLDTSGFCPDTSLVGTCAPAFLVPLQSCFEPTGACTITPTMPSGAYAVCWQNGSKLMVRASGSAVEVDASRNGTACYQVTGAQGSPLTLRPTGSASTLSYDNGSGTLTCPDGTASSVGSAYASCEAFKDLLDGPDFSVCSMGACP